MSYSSEVFYRDKPLAYWRLGESSGTVASDSSGNRYHGTYTGSPTLGATGLLSVDSATSVTFDGVDDYMNVNNTATRLSVSGSDAFSVACWVKTTRVSTGEEYFVSKPKSAYVGFGLFMHNAAPGLPAFRIGKSGSHSPLTNVAQLFGTSLINDGNPHYIVGVKDPTTMYIYVDGVLEGSQADPEAISDDNLFNVRVGTLGPEFGGSEGFMASSIQEVSIYNYPMTAEQVLRQYRYVYPTGSFGPVIYCPVHDEFEVVDKYTPKCGCARRDNGVE